MASTERLGEAADQRDAERFVGRTRALELSRAALEGEGPIRIIHVHGPGGVGKSALLRAVERQARQRERAVVHLDGRLVATTPEALVTEVAKADVDGSLLIIDEADQLAPLRFELRDLLRRSLPASTVVVIAGRATPGREWFDEGLDQVSHDLLLRPLDPTESRELLARYGVTDPADVDPLVTWAQGYPLALTLGANLQGGIGDPSPTIGRLGSTPAGDALDDLILARLGGREVADVDPDVLDVACIAPAVDARLLTAVLPGRPTRAGLAQLRALSVSEQLGSRTTLHRLVRRALRSRLRDTDPDRYRTIVLRVADHLRQRTLTDEPMIAVELADLIENPEVRLGFDASTTHYADFVRPGDLDLVATFADAGGTAWFARYRRWCEEVPRHAVAVRRATGELVGLTLVYLATDIPDWAHDAIEAGPVLEHIRAAGQLDTAVLMHDTVIMEDPTDPAACAEVIRVGNNAATVMVMARPRHMYVTATHRREGDGTEPLGYQDVPELRRTDDERELHTIYSDFGPEGAVGQLYGMILMEQQAEAPAGAADASGLALLPAVRAFQDDDALAASPLAPATGAVAERAAAVRTRVAQSLDEAFGPSEADQLLRRAIERTYLDPDGGHGIAQRELHMSRSSFYRHLQKARQQLVDRT
ncbi:MAG: AAA family ATPase [Aquihabitans sp.]